MNKPPYSRQGDRLGTKGARIFRAPLDCGHEHEVTTVTGFPPQATDSIICVEHDAPVVAHVVPPWVEQPNPKHDEER